MMAVARVASKLIPPPPVVALSHILINHSREQGVASQGSVAQLNCFRVPELHSGLRFDPDDVAKVLETRSQSEEIAKLLVNQILTSSRVPFVCLKLLST